MHIKVLIITHKKMGQELANTARSIIGPRDIEVFGIPYSKGIDEIKKEFGELMKRLLSDSAVLILTDMIGGTPTNISMGYLKDEKVEIVTGVNLPMVITALHKKDEIKDIRKLAEIITNTGIKSVIDCKQKLDR
ncbi:MAG: PTS sugar transporter subunit IIA [Elusimicrobia bacterium]|nr:PTS sugar transporter subunit IIA [Elusimicrobiota bacterium]